MADRDDHAGIHPSSTLEQAREALAQHGPGGILIRLEGALEVDYVPNLLQRMRYERDDQVLVFDFVEPMDPAVETVRDAVRDAVIDTIDQLDWWEVDGESLREHLSADAMRSIERVADLIRHDLKTSPVRAYIPAIAGVRMTLGELRDLCREGLTRAEQSDRTLRLEDVAASLRSSP